MGLEQEKYIVSWFWRLEVPHGGVSGFGFFGLEMSIFFPHLHRVVPLCMYVSDFLSGPSLLK